MPDHVLIAPETHVPVRYVPTTLTTTDKKRQIRLLNASRRAYRQGKYVSRPPIASFRSRPSGHVRRAELMYRVDTMKPTPLLARRTRCSLRGLRKIVNKGEGAYFSSGSRPNQTAQSWGYARLASAITGKNAACVDYHILESACHPTRSNALRLARKTCKKRGSP